jgi:transcriptional antiterminator RfaH
MRTDDSPFDRRPNEKISCVAAMVRQLLSCFAGRAHSLDGALYCSTEIMQKDFHCSHQSAWVVVNTQPHRERIALEHLLRQEFGAYCPLLHKRIRHARRSELVSRPLFPGYLFVQLDPDLPRWSPILSTVGVKTLVRFGERLSFIPNQFIDSIKAREIEGVVVMPDQPFQVGQKVKITDGAFDGIVATIVEMHERDRVVVLMDLLSRQVKLKIGVRQIASAS